VVLVGIAMCSFTFTTYYSPENFRLRYIAIHFSAPSNFSSSSTFSTGSSFSRRNPSQVKKLCARPTCDWRNGI
jgi:hypothetical protein